MWRVRSVSADSGGVARWLAVGHLVVEQLLNVGLSHRGWVTVSPGGPTRSIDEFSTWSQVRLRGVGNVCLAGLARLGQISFVLLVYLGHDGGGGRVVFAPFASFGGVGILEQEPVDLDGCAGDQG